MELEIINVDLTICKVTSETDIDLSKPFYFIGKTKEELSLVCPTKEAPDTATERDDGWKGFKIQGTLDFSLVGILAGISGILAENEIGIFAISTFNTDYILVKKENFNKAMKVLASAGYFIRNG
ncbi:ACT domain-containing protein [bacterium D16-51]|nr:ACT domain-containing protein [bacterium D16-59]RKI60874.1 ACT domain-containing protein [bacterium D16-51]